MFNRSGLIALAVAGAIVAWGAFYKDEAGPKPAPTSHAASRHDAPHSDHNGKDGGGTTFASAAKVAHGGHGMDGGTGAGRFDGTR